MDKMIDFTVFCIESYKQNHHITGKDTIKVFGDNEVFDYLRKFYDILHTTGEAYIIKDIDRYIKSRVN